MKEDDDDGEEEETNSEEDDDKDDDASAVDAIVKRKNKRKGSSSRSGSYRVLDNRDSLPFQVRVTTPDPYINQQIAKEMALYNTKKEKERMKKKQKKQQQEQQQQTAVSKNRKQSTSSTTGRRIASSVFKRNEDGSLNRVLGDFFLDKSTNCGDIVEVGDIEYEVQKARCQYKYVGGKRFNMVRKILEVKEIGRIAEEAYLMRQFSQSSGGSSGEFYNGTSSSSSLE